MSLQIRRDVFQAIADPTRRDLINLIAYHPQNLNSLADNFSISRSAVSQHIKILTECGLVTIRKQGRERICGAELSQLSQVADWAEQYRKLWEGRLDAMGNLLNQMNLKKEE